MGDFSDCIGWFPGLLITPAPGGDGTDDRLGTGMDMDVLDGDALLTLAAVTVEGFGQSRVGSRELGRPVSGSHSDRRKSGSYASHASNTPWRRYGSRSAARPAFPRSRRAALCQQSRRASPLSDAPLIEIVGLTPQNISDLINEEVGEIGTVGAADRPRITAMLSEGGNFAYYYSPRRRSFSRRCGSLGRSRSGARAINWFSL